MNTLIDKLHPKVIELIKNCGAKVYSYENYPYPETVGFYLAFYSTKYDDIGIKDADWLDLNLNALHELIHWSGIKGRSERSLVSTCHQVFSSDGNIEITEISRHTEESTAEFGSYRLMDLLGIPLKDENRYTKAIQRLDLADKRQALEDGKRAVEYLLQFVELEKAA